jgi:four helix bundle protein
MQDFRRLRVWREAHELTLAVYRATRAFPKDERFELSRQIRRAAAAVPANLAEGCGRPGDREFGYFVGVALGSAFELDYHITLAHDLGFVNERALCDLSTSLTRVKRMLMLLRRRLVPRANGQ